MKLSSGWTADAESADSEEHTCTTLALSRTNQIQELLARLNMTPTDGLVQSILRQLAGIHPDLLEDGIVEDLVNQ